jgi:hypothetical protein
MNLEEVKKIEEAMFAGLRGLASGQGKQQTKVQDIFIKDFMQDAMASINNGIAGDLIQLPQKTSAAPAGTSPNTQFGTATPAGVGPATGAAGSTVTPSNTTNSLNAPTVGAPKTSVSTKVSPGGTPGGITTGGATKTLTKPATSTKPYNWAPKGMKIDPNTKLSSLGATGDLAESKYENLNNIFESIMNIDEQAGSMPLADYLMSWFSQYMQGVAWEGSKPIIKTKIDALAKEYPNNLKSNLQKLAQTALALSKAATPAGAPNEFTQFRKASGQDVQQGYEEIKAALDELAKINPDLYNKFIKTLRPVTAQPGASAGLIEQKKRK